MKTATTGDALTILQKYLTDRGRSPQTVRAYLSDCRVFFEYTRTTVITDRHFETDVRRYMHCTLDVTPVATSKRRLAALRCLAKALGHTGTILGDYSMPTVTQAFAHPLPDGMADVRRVLEVAPTAEQRALVALVGFCGCRISEARAARPSHVDRHQMTLRIVGKGRKQRFVPIEPEILEILDAAERKPITSNGVRYELPYVWHTDRAARALLTDLGRRAGISRPVASHDFRMTAGTTWYQVTKDLRVTQELLGHADPATTAGYTLTKDQAKRDAIRGALA